MMVLYLVDLFYQIAINSKGKKNIIKLDEEKKKQDEYKDKYMNFYKESISGKVIYIYSNIFSCCLDSSKNKYKIINDDEEIDDDKDKRDNNVCFLIFKFFLFIFITLFYGFIYLYELFIDEYELKIKDIKFFLILIIILYFDFSLMKNV
jgi:hypothetical protein